MDGYRALAVAIIREVVRDISVGPRGDNRSAYLSALAFLRTPLFNSICDNLGMDSTVVKRKILQLSASKPGKAVKVKTKKPAWLAGNLRFWLDASPQNQKRKSG
ncbi:MAG: hypothetical protein H0Z39_02725 [Peptococcaceae bacterium]|nr:hypothetical protein [Peptococcaceae bacterium]